MRGRTFFNERAHEWDAMMPQEEAGRVEELIRSLPINPGDAVLDVGTGTGVLIPVLRSVVGKNGMLAAMDYAEKMLVQALLKMPTERIFTAADIHSTPLANGIFNAAVCFNCFPHFHDKHRAFSEMYRVLKPGGVLIICHSMSREGINGLHREVGGVVKNDRIPDEPVMREIFSRAGFKNIDISNGSDSYMATGWKKTGSFQQRFC